MSTIPMRPLSFGETIDGGLQLYRRDFGLYYLIALIAAVPGHVLVLVTGINSAPFDPGQEFSADVFAQIYQFMGVLILASLVSYVGWVALGAAMADRMEGRGTTVPIAYRVGLSRFPAVLGATLLAALIALPFMLLWFFGVSAVFSAVLGAAVSGGSVLIPVAAVVIAFAVAAAMVLVWLAATFAILPGAIVERRGPIRALKRSVQLCKGGWLRVAGVVAMVFILQAVVTLGVTLIFGMGDFFVSPESLGEISATRQWLLQTLNLLVGTLVTPFAVGAVFMLYHDRRVRSEAYDLETRARTMTPS